MGRPLNFRLHAPRHASSKTAGRRRTQGVPVAPPAPPRPISSAPPANRAGTALRQQRPRGRARRRDGFGRTTSGGAPALRRLRTVQARHFRAVQSGAQLLRAVLSRAELLSTHQPLRLGRRHHCPDQKRPRLAVKRPARPYERAIGNRAATGSSTAA
jgi:hypothetical protein